MVKTPGSTEQFVILADGAYHPSPGKAAQLTKNPDGSHQLRSKHGILLDFDADGNTTTYTYDEFETMTSRS